MDEPCTALDPISTGVIEGADRRAAPRAGGRDRHPQPRPGAARRGQGRVHVSRRSRRVRDRRGGVGVRAPRVLATTSRGRSDEPPAPRRGASRIRPGGAPRQWPRARALRAARDRRELRGRGAPLAPTSATAWPAASPSSGAARVPRRAAGRLPVLASPRSGRRVPTGYGRRRADLWATGHCAATRAVRPAVGAAARDRYRPARRPLGYAGRRAPSAGGRVKVRGRSPRRAGATSAPCEHGASPPHVKGELDVEQGHGEGRSEGSEGSQGDRKAPPPKVSRSLPSKPPAAGLEHRQKARGSSRTPRRRPIETGG